MNSAFNHNLNRIILSFLAFSVLAFGVLSIVTMNHENGSMMNCPTAISRNSDCGADQQAEMCISYHLGLMQALTQAVPGHGGVQLSALLLAVVLHFVAFGLVRKLIFLFSRLRTRLKRFYENTFASFINQCGFWLVLFEKRDPQVVFA